MGCRTLMIDDLEIHGVWMGLEDNLTTRSGLGILETGTALVNHIALNCYIEPCTYHNVGFTSTSKHGKENFACRVTEHV